MILQATLTFYTTFRSTIKFTACIIKPFRVHIQVKRAMLLKISMKYLDHLALSSINFPSLLLLSSTKRRQICSTFVKYTLTSSLLYWQSRHRKGLSAFSLHINKTGYKHLKQKHQGILDYLKTQNSSTNLAAAQVSKG